MPVTDEGFAVINVAQHHPGTDLDGCGATGRTIHTEVYESFGRGTKVSGFKLPRYVEKIFVTLLS